jgi:hypothetical protein
VASCCSPEPTTSLAMHAGQRVSRLSVGASLQNEVMGSHINVDAHEQIRQMGMVSPLTAAGARGPHRFLPATNLATRWSAHALNSDFLLESIARVRISRHQSGLTWENFPIYDFAACEFSHKWQGSSQILLLWDIMKDTFASCWPATAFAHGGWDSTDRQPRLRARWSWRVAYRRPLPPPAPTPAAPLP